MAHFGFTIVGVNDEHTIANVAELNSLLKNVGISFELTPYGDMDGRGYFDISIDIDTLNKIRTRNAGRKVNHKKSQNYKCSPTIGEVLEWKKSMTHQQIIEKIGCPRATYYRAWKKLNGDFDDLSSCDFAMDWGFFW